MCRYRVWLAVDCHQKEHDRMEGGERRFAIRQPTSPKWFSNCRTNDASKHKILGMRESAIGICQGRHHGLWICPGHPEICAINGPLETSKVLIAILVDRIVAIFTVMAHGTITDPGFADVAETNDARKPSRRFSQQPACLPATLINTLV